MVRIHRGLRPPAAPLTWNSLTSTPGSKSRQPGPQILRKSEWTSQQCAEAATNGQRHSHEQSLQKELSLIHISEPTRPAA